MIASLLDISAIKYQIKTADLSQWTHTIQWHLKTQKKVRKMTICRYKLFLYSRKENSAHNKVKNDETKWNTHTHIHADETDSVQLKKYLLLNYCNLWWKSYFSTNFVHFHCLHISLSCMNKEYCLKSGTV